MIPVT
jgi:hypothetical protein